MSIATIEPFMAGVALLVALAALVLVGSVAVAAWEFFAEHRTERVAQRASIGSYYRHLAVSH